MTAGAGVWPSHTYLHMHALNLICQCAIPSFPARGPRSQCLFMMPGSVSYRLFQRSQKQYLSSVTEHHMMAFVLQNEPRCIPGGSPGLLYVPQLEGVTRVHHPQTGYSGAKKEASVCPHSSQRRWGSGTCIHWEQLTCSPSSWPYPHPSPGPRAQLLCGMDEGGSASFPSSMPQPSRCSSGSQGQGEAGSLRGEGTQAGGIWGPCALRGGEC